MSRPRLLDLFCGAGGAAMGYHRAGFDVVGVDIKPQPHYPFEFHQADALTFPLDGFDAIHASPPCQGYSTGARSEDAKATPRLLAETRARLLNSSVPYVIENVYGARAEMRATSSGYLTLCGSMFGGDHARRHRLFETTPFLWQPYHPDCRGWNLRLAQRLGVDWRDVQAVGHGRGKRSKVWPRVLGIDWTNDYGMSQAIPPPIPSGSVGNCWPPSPRSVPRDRRRPPDHRRRLRPAGRPAQRPPALPRRGPAVHRTGARRLPLPPGGP